MEIKRLPERHDSVATDGSEVRVLLGVRGGGLAHFELGAGETATAVRHRTVEEVWLFLGGRGQMWRRDPDGAERIDDVEAGVSIDIPLGVTFQWRALGDEPLSAVGATMPPWPAAGDADPCDGPWTPTVSGPGAAP
jgi:mannose-6-phosphate isomerase-like protein (cupin superfamily)